MQKQLTKYGETQVIETTPRKPTQSAKRMMPSVLVDAPMDFRARDFSLDAFRAAYGVKPTRALEMLLGGIILRLRDLERGARTPMRDLGRELRQELRERVA